MKQEIKNLIVKLALYSVAKEIDKTLDAFTQRDVDMLEYIKHNMAYMDELPDVSIVHVDLQHIWENFDKFIGEIKDGREARGKLDERLSASRN